MLTRSHYTPLHRLRFSARGSLACDKSQTEKSMLAVPIRQNRPAFPRSGIVRRAVIRYSLYTKRYFQPKSAR